STLSNIASPVLELVRLRGPCQKLFQPPLSHALQAHAVLHDHTPVGVGFAAPLLGDARLEPRRSRLGLRQSLADLLGGLGRAKVPEETRALQELVAPEEALPLARARRHRLALEPALERGAARGGDSVEVLGRAALLLDDFLLDPAQAFELGERRIELAVVQAVVFREGLL